jgi:hypothetical protein
LEAADVCKEFILIYFTLATFLFGNSAFNLTNNYTEMRFGIKRVQTTTITLYPLEVSCFQEVKYQKL